VGGNLSYRQYLWMRFVRPERAGYVITPSGHTLCPDGVMSVFRDLSLLNSETLLLSISENIAISHILPKTRFFALHFYRRQCGNLNHFEVIGPKATAFGEMTQNNGHYGRSRSPILVPIESRYAIFYYTIACLYSHRHQVIADYWLTIRFRHWGVGNLS